MPHYKEVQREIVLNRFPEGLMQHLMLLSSPGNIFLLLEYADCSMGGLQLYLPSPLLPLNKLFSNEAWKSS